MPTNTRSVYFFDIGKQAAEGDQYVVIDFLERLPENLEYVIETYFKKTINEKSYQTRVDYYSFTRAFTEARRMYERSLERTINTENISLEMLEEIGFTGESLRLKATLLNSFWNSVAVPRPWSFRDIFNFRIFGKNRLFRSLKEFLDCLKLIMESLAKLIPGVEPLLELLNALGLLHEMEP